MPCHQKSSACGIFHGGLIALREWPNDPQIGCCRVHNAPDGMVNEGLQIKERGLCSQASALHLIFDIKMKLWYCTFKTLKVTSDFDAGRFKKSHLWSHLVPNASGKHGEGRIARIVAEFHFRSF